MDMPHGSDFFDSLYEYVDQKNEAKNKWKQAQALEEELEHQRATNTTLHCNFKTCLEQDNICTKYVNMQEKRVAVLKEINMLDAKLQKLKITIADEKRKITSESEDNIKREEELGERKIQELKEQIQNRTYEHKLKVEQLNNESELVQAGIDLERDEIETTLRKDLIDLNTKIRRQRNANKDLQMQIDDLRQRKQATSVLKQNFGTTLHPDDLSFFRLEKLDDMFDSHLKNSAATEETSLQSQSAQIYSAYNNANINTLNSNKIQQKLQVQSQVANSKYPPLHIETSAIPDYVQTSRQSNLAGRTSKEGDENRIHRAIIAEEANNDKEQRGNLVKHSARSSKNNEINPYLRNQQFENDNRNKLEKLDQIGQNNESGTATSISIKHSNQRKHPDMYQTPIFRYSNCHPENDESKIKERAKEGTMARNIIVQANKSQSQTSCKKMNVVLKPMQMHLKEGNQTNRKHYTKVVEPINNDKNKTNCRKSQFERTNEERKPAQNNKAKSDVAGNNAENKSVNQIKKNRQNRRNTIGDTNTTENKCPTKKRKLFNMDDLDYLEFQTDDSD